ncbi:hypothetical protein C7M84_005067 [Penaeus vannamei]|uniref:Uncharacterized protein n=1 Tax=Penaeus vannamei TaxID=6689 RepID=A0A423TIQ5_PENVA|nr:hypothetical protein C7M84_005067 [Penaeus vannamei]
MTQFPRISHFLHPPLPHFLFLLPSSFPSPPALLPLFPSSLFPLISFHFPHLPFLSHPISYYLVIPSSSHLSPLPTPFPPRRYSFSPRSFFLPLFSPSPSPLTSFYISQFPFLLRTSSPTLSRGSLPLFSFPPSAPSLRLLFLSSRFLSDLLILLLTFLPPAFHPHPIYPLSLAFFLSQTLLSSLPSLSLSPITHLLSSLLPFLLPTILPPVAPTSSLHQSSPSPLASLSSSSPIPYPSFHLALFDHPPTLPPLSLPLLLPINPLSGPHFLTSLLPPNSLLSTALLVYPPSHPTLPSSTSLPSLRHLPRLPHLLPSSVISLSLPSLEPSSFPLPPLSPSLPSTFSPSPSSPSSPNSSSPPTPPPLSFLLLPLLSPILYSPSLPHFLSPNSPLILPSFSSSAHLPPAAHPSRFLFLVLQNSKPSCLASPSPPPASHSLAMPHKSDQIAVNG